MLLERFYDDSLAQVSYMVGCQATGEALVVDPNRDVDRYLLAARRRGLEICWVTETHIHADYLSGTRELAARAGAVMLLSGEGGEGWGYGFADEEAVRLLRDGETFSVGNVELRALHTPGHTPEHMTFLVVDRAASEEPVGALTGDFIFVGDVGRPDLLEKTAGVRGSMEGEARRLFRSLRSFRAFPDHLQLWPGHGAGSACGRALGDMPQTTLGYEKLVGWAFQIDDEDAFVDEVLEGQPEAPTYFAVMKRLNRDGPPILGGSPRPDRLDPQGLSAALEARAPVVDLRPRRRFQAGHVPGTLSLPLNGSFTTWAGWLLSHDQELHLLEDGAGEHAREAARRLALIGLDGVVGYFDGAALETWNAECGGLEPAEVADPEAADRDRQAGRASLLDVRSRSEWEQGHLPGAVHVHLGSLPERLDEVPREGRVVVYCATGARSGIGQGILLARGWDQVANLEGGIEEWRRQGREVVEPRAAPASGA